MKYHIEKNTVQETLVIPLYGRKVCTEIYPDLYRDDTAQKLIEQIDYDFSLLEEQAKKNDVSFWIFRSRDETKRPCLRDKRLLKNSPECGCR